MDECKPLGAGSGIVVDPRLAAFANGSFAQVIELPYLGRAVQVEPMKPMSKAPGTKLLKLKCEKLLSIFGFKFNLRRYTWAAPTPRRPPANRTGRGRSTRRPRCSKSWAGGSWLFTASIQLDVELVNESAPLCEHSP